MRRIRPVQPRGTLRRFALGVLASALTILVAAAASARTPARAGPPEGVGVANGAEAARGPRSSDGLQQQALDLEIVGQIGAWGTLAVTVDEGDRRLYAVIGKRLVVVDISDPARPRRMGESEDQPSLVLGLAAAGGYLYVAAGIHGLRVFDVSDPSAPREIGALATQGSASGIFVSGSRAYLADGSAGLRVLDIGDPAVPRQLGWLDTPGSARGVFVSGSVAYVADNQFGLRLIDVGNPSEPRELSRYDTPGYACDVHVIGSTAYVADGTEGGLRIIDVADPSAPHEVGAFETFGNAWGVFVGENHAFLAHGWNGLRIIDVEDPTVPREIGALDTPGHTSAVHVSANYAYVADNERGLRIIDVADPATPSFVGVLDTFSSAQDIEVTGNLAYVAAGADGLRVIDVGDPSVPRELGTLDTPGSATGIHVSGSLVYLADGSGGLRVIDVTDPAVPRELDWISTSGYASDVFVSGSVAYVAAGAGGLRVIDAADATALRELGTVSTLGFANGVFVSETRVFLADGMAGLRVIDASNPNAPRALSQLDTEGYANVVFVGGRTAFVASGGGGFRVIDVAASGTLRDLGMLDIPKQIIYLHVSGNRAYVLDNDGNLRVIDVADPGAPRELAALRVPGQANAVQVNRGTAFLAAGRGGLQVIDVADPSAPRERGALSTPGQALGVVASGSTAYVASGMGGLAVIDAADPAAPRALGSQATQENFEDVFVSGTRAYVAAGLGGLRVIDVADSGDPHELGSQSTPGYAKGIFVSRSWAYVADGPSGLQAIDLTNPAAPSPPRELSIEGFAEDVFLSGSRAYVAAGAGGLRVIDLKDPAAPDELGAIPAADYTYGVDVIGDLAFVADRKRGLLVIDVADPSKPQTLSELDLPGQALDIFVSGSLAFVACEGAGLWVIDIADPGAPLELAAIHLPGWAADVHVDGNRAYVANSNGGLVIVDLRADVPSPTATISPSATPTSTPPPGTPPSPTPATPLPNPLPWPNPALTSALHTLLRSYYDQEAAPDTPVQWLKPEVEGDKAPAAKDPDTLWEALAAIADPASTTLSPACHAAATPADFVNCSGARIALARRVPYAGGLTLFRPAPVRPEEGADPAFYTNSDLVDLAAQFALYHAFVYDFDAPNAGPYEAGAGREPRDAKRYHARMIQAYEAHMRSILVPMLADTRHHPGFQLALTRSAGWLLAPYVRTVQTVEEIGAWASPADRGAAIALVNGLNQRIWWEWVVPQPEGPRSAGKAPLGSQATFDAALARDPRLAGADRFVYLDRVIPSLRPAAIAGPGFDGLWFDADYGPAGEITCTEKHRPVFGPNWQRCMALARRQALDGPNSPFGSYFATGPDCLQRAGGPTRFACGETNLGSMAEEWLGTYVGARAGMRLIERLAAAGDPQLPAGAIGPGHYQEVNQRLGYGVAGFHGGEGLQDDLEWTFAPPGGLAPGQATPTTVSIRTLSAARHDGEPQNGRFSLGEIDNLPNRRAGYDGDTWLELGGQEYPGAMENHAPGPSPLYGAVIGGMVLGDKVEGGLSPSLYDNRHRNQPDEFSAWLGLLQATFYRCQGVDDPADPRCLAFEQAAGGVRRVPLFTDPQRDNDPPAMRYLWRDPAGAVDPRFVADADRRCSRKDALAFGRMPVDDSVADGYLLSEAGFGAYGLLLQAGGAFMRLASARYDEAAPGPEYEEPYLRQRAEQLLPWYGEMQRLVAAIARHYGPAELGYVPDIENAPCARDTGSGPAPKTLDATGMSLDDAIAHRARWYSAAAAWYWWYDSAWLDVDGAAWDG